MDARCDETIDLPHCSAVTGEIEITAAASEVGQVLREMSFSPDAPCITLTSISSSQEKEQALQIRIDDVVLNILAAKGSGESCNADRRLRRLGDGGIYEK
jgi:hypothetical protein